MEQIGGKEPVTLRSLNYRVPRDLETIVLKTLSKHPADRYASATGLAEDLARFLNHEPVRARRISPIGRFSRVARRHPGITTVTAVASAVVLSIATYAYVRILKEKNEAIEASNEKNVALQEKELEAEKARAAAHWALSANATNLLLSEMPDRRAKGLDLLQKITDPEKAAPLDQDPALSPDRLRDQAVEFLVLRDVQSCPDFPTGPTRGIEFGPGGTVLAAVSDDGQEVSLWNAESRSDSRPSRWGKSQDSLPCWRAERYQGWRPELKLSRPVPERLPARAAPAPRPESAAGRILGRSSCSGRPYPGCGPPGGRAAALRCPDRVAAS